MGTWRRRSSGFVAVLAVSLLVGVLTSPVAAKNVKKVKPAGTFAVAVTGGLTTTNYWEFVGVQSTVFNFYLLPSRVSLYTLAAGSQVLVPSVAVGGPPVPECDDATGCHADIAIRERVRWSDNSWLTAADVAFTLNTARQIVQLAEFGSGWSPFVESPFAGAEAVTDEVVRLHFDAPPGLGSYHYGVLQTPILQAAYWEPIVGDLAEPEDVAALYEVEPDGEPQAGPFLLAEHTDDAVVHVPNRRYFRQSNVVTEYAGGGYLETDRKGNEVARVGDTTGAVSRTYQVGPFAERVVYTVYPTSDEAAAAVAAGLSDYYLTPLGLTQDQADSLAGAGGVEIITNPGNGIRYLAFNTRSGHPPMSDPAFRRAFATLFDGDLFAFDVAAGIEVGADSTIECFAVSAGTEIEIPCPEPGASPPPDVCRAAVFGFEHPCPPYEARGAITPVDGVVPPGNAQWHNPDLTRWGDGLTYPERLAAALELLATAGYSWVDGGAPVVNLDGTYTPATGELLLPGGTPVGSFGHATDEDGNPVYGLELLAPGVLYDPIRAALGERLGAMLGDLGVPVVVNRTHFFEIIDRVFPLDPTQQDWDMYMLGWGLSVFPEYLDVFFTTGSDFNTPGYSDPYYDALAADFRACATVEECVPPVYAMQEKLAEDVPYLVLFSGSVVEAYRADRVAFPFTSALDGLQEGRGHPELVRPLGG